MMRTGVIGLGTMGWHHARVYSELDESTLVAVADVDSEVGLKAAEKYSATYYRDYREMLAKEALDAVSIAVPTSLHKAVALDCIAEKVPMLIEKPIAGTLEDGNEIIAKAGSAGIPIMIGHIERFNPAVQKLKALIAENALDRITSIVARRVGIYPSRIKDANVIVDIAVHDIDICNFLLGRLPDSVHANAGKALNSERIDYATLFMDYGDTEIFIQVNWITPVKIRELNITGIKGYGELNFLTQSLKLYESQYETTYDSFNDYVIKFGTPNIREIDVKTAEPLKLELQQFLVSLKNDTAMPVPAQEGLAALKIALRAIESYETRTICKL
ncbi:Gfo/Idh/MocA family oxidoreductase [candidate division KSB1 bacterium]|nr:Gfo/Idh/MocA family oxidoreductase [candidate division KSB1 bacterium]